MYLALELKSIQTENVNFVELFFVKTNFLIRVFQLNMKTKLRKITILTCITILQACHEKMWRGCHVLCCGIRPAITGKN